MIYKPNNDKLDKSGGGITGDLEAAGSTPQYLGTSDEPFYGGTTLFFNTRLLNLIDSPAAISFKENNTSYSVKPSITLSDNNTTIPTGGAIVNYLSSNNYLKGAGMNLSSVYTVQNSNAIDITMEYVNYAFRSGIILTRYSVIFLNLGWSNGLTTGFIDGKVISSHSTETVTCTVVGNLVNKYTQFRLKSSVEWNNFSFLSFGTATIYGYTPTKV